jgi:hypothetical protein
MKPDTIGDVVTLVLSVLPLGIAVISFVVAGARWGGKTTFQAVIFLLFGLISLGCFVWLYARKENVLRVLKDREILSTENSMPRKVGLTLQLLIGAISVLASVTLLISGGWELIQGSITIGLILAPVGMAILVLIRRPRWSWNIFWRTYSTLTE